RWGWRSHIELSDEAVTSLIGRNRLKGPRSSRNISRVRFPSENKIVLVVHSNRRELGSRKNLVSRTQKAAKDYRTQIRRHSRDNHVRNGFAVDPLADEGIEQR